VRVNTPRLVDATLKDEMVDTGTAVGIVPGDKGLNRIAPDVVEPIGVTA
jgi:hypothetical protein